MSMTYGYSDDLAGMVFEALDNAEANGYYQYTLDPDEITNDLRDYDSELAGFAASAIKPLVIKWLEEKRS